MNKGENDVYMMVKVQKRKTGDFNQVKYIKNKTDRLLVKDRKIKNRRREYINKLINEESEKTTIELDDSSDDTNR
jgi:hypothetical protein